MRRRELVPEDVTNRIRSVRWFHTDRPSELSGQLFQYYQDVHVRVAPIGGRAHERPSFRVRVDPATTDAEETVLRAIHAATQTPSEQLASDVCDLISYETAHLLLFGRAVHEVVCDDAGRRYFFPLPHGTLLRVGPFVGQLVPPDPIQHYPRRIIWLRRRRLWWLTPSRGLGGHALSNLRSVLRSINYVPPDWSLPSMDRLRTDFDFKTWVYEMDVLVARAARPWGYPIPHPARRQMTDFHSMYEHVRFAITMCRLREHIVSELNAQLARAANPVRVVIEGLPTSSELETTLGQLSRGEMKFMDLLPATRW